MKITKREKIVLMILLITFPLFSWMDQQTIIKQELFWLIFFVAPLGFYIATDPERRKAE